MMLKKLLALFQKQTKEKSVSGKNASPAATKKKKIESTRIGELGEHKINIQLDQLSKENKHLWDVMIPNPKSRTGYSQIDHLVITPYCIFVIETKNYNGEIRGNREDQQWSVSNRYKMYNPLRQNYGHIKALEGLLKDNKDIRFISMISFTMRCRFAIDPELRKIQSDELIVYDVELSEFIQRKLIRIKAENPAPIFSESDISRIFEVVSKANITDPGIREQHKTRAKTK